jgi:hypothetical protein
MKGRLCAQASQLLLKSKQAIEDGELTILSSLEGGLDFIRTGKFPSPENTVSHLFRGTHPRLQGGCSKS